MTHNSLITTSKAIAIISFVMGTVLFILQLNFIDSNSIFVFGFFFVLTAIAINAISLIALVYRLISQSFQKLELSEAIFIVLLNIPIAGLYFCILSNKL